MSSRLLLVACKDAAKGPWNIVKGNECAVRIAKLSSTECVWLELESPDGHEFQEFNQTGTFPLDLSCTTRFRATKRVNATGESLPTTVEVLIR